MTTKTLTIIGSAVHSSSARVQFTSLRPRQRDSGAIDYVRPTRTNDQLWDDRMNTEETKVAPGGRPREEGATGGENAKISKSARINKINLELNIVHSLLLECARAFSSSYDFQPLISLPTFRRWLYTVASVFFQLTPLSLSTVAFALIG